MKTDYNCKPIHFHLSFVTEVVHVSMNLENEHLSQSIIAKFTHRIHISFPNNRIICQKKGNDSNDNHITSSLYQEEGLLTCGEEFDEEYSEEYEEIYEKYDSKKCEKDNKRELNNRFIKKKAQYINFENSHLLELFQKYHNSHIILKMMVLHTDWSDFHLYYPQDCDLLLQIFENNSSEHNSLSYLLALLLIIAQHNNVIFNHIICNFNIISRIELHNLFIPFCRIVIGIIEIDVNLADPLQQRGWYKFLLNCRNDPYYLIYSTEYIECIAYFTAHITKIEDKLWIDLLEIADTALDILLSRHKYVQAKLVLFLYRMKNMMTQNNLTGIGSKYNNILSSLLQPGTSKKIKFFIRFFLID